MTDAAVKPAPFWAKTSRDPNDDRFHPLVCHLIDVAMVTEALWDSVLPEATRRWIADGLGLDEVRTRRWISYLAGLHDIGKACPSFQLHHPPAREWLVAAQFPVDGFPRNADAPHGTLSAVILIDLLSTRDGLNRSSAATLATAIGGHHGIFPSDGDQQPLARKIGSGPWTEAREQLIESLTSVVGQPPNSRPDSPSNATAMWIAGLVSVADWIGSNTDFFEPEGDGSDPYRTIDAEAYAEVARERASEALEKLGWLGWTSDRTVHQFQDMFPFPPNALQQAAVDLAPRIGGPGLVIVEAPMGLGKTEAALYLMDYFGAVNGQRGGYVALPTMATSNQMFSRVRDFLATRYPNAITNLQLLHGQTALSQEFRQLLDAGRFVPDSVDEQGEGRVIAAEWFTYRKRGLLSPFGVGTVDQTLLGVLQTRHVFVRLFGLANKTLVVDEIHAYDTYMTSLIERLLEWCAALGSSVILLSATLPDSRRRQLAAAYARGLGNELLGVLPAASYPRLSWVSQAGGDALSVSTPPDDDKTLRLEWIDGALPRSPGEPFPLGTFLREKVGGDEDGCVAVICNTVRRAQEVYQALQGSFAPGELGLLHARFLFQDRDEREKQALQRFGKPGSDVVMADGKPEPVERPKRFVLVATQVIEQSLDLDFDLMVSDFAPVDLLLQRAGRLHRHRRDPRPDGLEEAELWVTQPVVSDDGTPEFEAGTPYVYDEHILLRSWLALQGTETIRLPDDVESLIEAVYSEREAPASLSEPLANVWVNTQEKLDEKIASEQQEARNRWLREPSYGEAFWQYLKNWKEEESPEFHPAHQALTRLAAPSVQVICLYGSKEQAFLDIARSEPIDYRDTARFSVIRQLLMRSVSLGDRRIIGDLLGQKPEASWSASPLLRHHRLILLDEKGRSAIGNKYFLNLDAERGVIVTERQEGAL